MYTQTHVHTYTQTHTHTYMHTHRHMYIHTDTCTCTHVHTHKHTHHKKLQYFFVHSLSWVLHSRGRQRAHTPSFAFTVLSY
ncbi:unnamed protein product [Staurois parvus]|uniref:Uncharacterized protein n=1 Tax=Staurois parvus TaxID=386267 RepID=A0ABN9GIW0_9NEOB|nr:unnamed protein product [Staurois parvus]